MAIDFIFTPQKKFQLFFCFLISGIMLGLSFLFWGKVSLGFLAWFALLPFFYVTKQLPPLKRYLLSLLLFFISYILIHSWWLSIFSYKANLLVFFTQGPFMAIPFLLYYLINNKRSYFLAIITFPFIYTLNEFYINSLSFALPTYFIAYSQSSYYWLIQFADIFGMSGVTFWTLLINILIISSISLRSKKLAFVSLASLVVPLIYSYFCLYIIPESWVGKNPKETKVSLVQTNQNVYYATDSTALNKAYYELITLADSAVATHQPDLIVLPESAIPVPFFTDSSLFNFTKNAVISWQTSVALGFPDIPDSSKPNHYENKAFIFTPQLAHYWDSLNLKKNDITVYQKENGLPFIETNPFFKNELSFTNRCMIPGNKEEIFIYNNFDGETFKTALAICWDQMQPKKFTNAVNLGATFMILMNNDAWFGKTNGPKQLKAITQLRAIENRRAIARCSNGGISCFIDPFGRVYGEIPWFVSTISTENIQCVSKKSFYSKFPNLFIITCFLGLLAILSFNIFPLLNRMEK